MTAPLDLDDGQLAEALRGLGTHLDLGPSATAEAQAERVGAILAVLPELPDTGPGAPSGPTGDRRSARRLLVAAVIVVAAGLAVVAVAPARQAVARWLGVGAVRIERMEEPPPRSSTTTSSLPPAPTLPSGAIDLGALAADLPFPVRLPDPALAGEATAAAIDRAVASGLLEVHYPAFTFVALAGAPGSTPMLSKALGPDTRTEPVVVGGSDGLWITGDPHEVASIGPDGEPQPDRVRGAGDVLLWESGGVTYRIEGAASLDDALALAASLR